MNTIKYFKTCLILLYYLLGIALIGGLVHIILVLFRVDKSLPILGTKLSLFSAGLTEVLIITFLNVLLIFFLFRAVRFLKSTFYDLSEQNYFGESVIKNFKYAGNSFFLTAALEIVIKILNPILLDTKFKFGLNMSVMIFVLIGLFLKFLGEVFAKGKRLEEENDLTI